MYESKKINERLIAIEEKIEGNIIDVMFLVIGQKRVALIDTGMGLTGNLDIYIKSLTKLPVIVLNTHCHPDHVASNPLFEDIYMSRNDDELIPWSLSLQSRLVESEKLWNPDENSELTKRVRENFVDAKDFSYEDIEDSDQFDLGGVVLETITTPGHTKGSVCFVNDAEKYILVGDTINPAPWLYLEHSTSIVEYVKSLKKVKYSIDNSYNLYCGHMVEPLPYKIIDELIEAGEEIIEGNNTNDISFKPPLSMNSEINPKIHQNKGINLIYNPSNIK